MNEWQRTVYVTSDNCNDSKTNKEWKLARYDYLRNLNDRPNVPRATLQIEKAEDSDNHSYLLPSEQVLLGLATKTHEAPLLRKTVAIKETSPPSPLPDGYVEGAPASSTLVKRKSPREEDSLAREKWILFGFELRCEKF